MTEQYYQKVLTLPCWKKTVRIEPLGGGMTNLNFKVTEEEDQYVVRLGNDIPHHLVLRSNEVAASQTAYRIGVSPEVIYVEPGVLVIRYINGRVLDEKDIRNQANLQRIVTVLKRFHQEMPKHFSGACILFWVFQVLRHYRNELDKGNSRYGGELPELTRIAEQLEGLVGPVHIVYGHNDLLAANFIDDGKQIWLIDFDYAGFNSPVFDLANLASNNELTEADERGLWESYFGMAPDESQWRGYHAMKCASLLRETMWSMVSELHSDIDFDYAGYTEQNRVRFERCYLDFQQQFA